MSSINLTLNANNSLPINEATTKYNTRIIKKYNISIFYYKNYIIRKLFLKSVTV